VVLQSSGSEELPNSCSEIAVIAPPEFAVGCTAVQRPVAPPEALNVVVASAYRSRANGPGALPTDGAGIDAAKQTVIASIRAPDAASAVVTATLAALK
jgi:hypothetical protein